MGKIKDKRLELLIEEVNIFLNNDQLFEHCLAVAKTAEALTEELTDSNERRSQAFIAGLLHDIGGIYPNDQRVEKAEIFNIELLTEEREFPLIIHQKLSKYLASQHFKITDEQVQQIKDLRAKGLSYRAIQNQTGWSSVTINRALNGIYD